MVTIDREPVIRVGLLTGAREVSFDLAGTFVNDDGAAMPPGSYTARVERGTVKLEGAASLPGASRLRRSALMNVSLRCAESQSGLGFIGNVKSRKSFKAS